MTTDLAALLAEHVGAHHITVDGGSYIECDALGCDSRWATVDYNGTQHAKHVAEVIAAAGWVKGRKEWGVRFERDAGPTMDNPSGEVTNTQVVSDEPHARACVERNVPISARNRRVVRRYVTDWEEDK